jgi:transposase
MAMPTIAHGEATLVTVGVDTHLETHTAVALDQLGRRLGALQIGTRRGDFEALVAWAGGFGELEAFGIEGTNSYGAGLTRFLVALGYAVFETTRPDRATRRNKGKSDPIDAEAAARAVLAGDVLGPPKDSTDTAEMVRMLRIARSTAIKARTQAINALHALVVTAPGELRDDLRSLNTARLVERARGFRLGVAIDDTVTAAKLTMRALARRIEHLDNEITELTDQLDRLVAAAVPTVVALFGAGTDTAGQLLVTAGDNPDRLHSDAAFSMLCGASPRPAWSGAKPTNRYRLNRGGDRQANAALYRIALVRMAHHAPTRAYVERRTKEGKTKREIIRCLKRYIAREVFTALNTDLAARPTTP